MVYQYLVYGLSAYSILMSSAFLWLYRKSKKLKKSSTTSKDATQLMRDLLNGGAIAVVSIVDPDSILLQSPGDM